jgi:ADP-ribose pyrophosphatase YjhB (NUDIX family)
MQNKELAGCVIYDEQGKLLVLHRNTPELVQWELPGGKVEPGEDIAEATIREAREELLVTIEIVKQLGKASFEHDNRTWHYTWLEAIITDGLLGIGEPDKFDNVAYIDPKDLLTRSDISPNLVNLLKVIS